MRDFVQRLEHRVRRKAEGDLTITPRLQSLLNQGPVQFTPDGTVDYLESFTRSYSHLYRTQSSLRAVVDFLSRNIAECRIKLFRTQDGTSTPQEDHPVQQLLDHPFAGVPRARFMRQVVADKAIYDTAAVWKIRADFNPEPNEQGRIRNTGVVRSLVRIPIPNITVFQGTLTSPIDFRLVVGRDNLLIPAADVIWMPGYSPSSNTSGVPPVETLRQVLAEEWAAAKNQENQWRRGAHLNVVFVQDKDSPGLGEDARKRFKQEWQNRYGGVGASQAGEVPLFPPGLEPKPLVTDAAAMQYLATRKLAREEVCLAFGIQPQLLGITQANFASMDMFHQMLYQDTLAPWMVPIQEELEEQLLVEFEEQKSGFHLEFNINAKMAGSFLEQAKVGQQAVGGPWMTRDEFREKFQNLPPLPEGGDDIIVPLNVILGGGPQANPAAPTNDGQREASVRGFLDSAGRLHLVPQEEAT